ncbi:GNAT family N-acetyltransferase, partial [Cryobacterium sp. 10I1]
ESHGRGVAAALMTATLDAARDRGARGAWLGVNQENARAIRFYGKHGFARVGTKHFLVGDRYEDDFVLERAL